MTSNGKSSQQFASEVRIFSWYSSNPVDSAEDLALMVCLHRVCSHVETWCSDPPRVIQKSMSELISEKVDKPPVPMILRQGVACGHT